MYLYMHTNICAWLTSHKITRVSTRFGVNEPPLQPAPRISSPGLRRPWGITWSPGGAGLLGSPGIPWASAMNEITGEMTLVNGKRKVYGKIDGISWFLSSGCWFEPNPCEKYEFVNWDDYSQYMENKTCSKPPTRTGGQLCFIIGFLKKMNWLFLWDETLSIKWLLVLIAGIFPVPWLWEDEQPMGQANGGWGSKDDSH